MQVTKSFKKLLIDMEAAANVPQQVKASEDEKNSIIKVIQERSAELISGGHVFYNPVQEFNRDLSIAVLNVYFRHILTKERHRKSVRKPTEDNSDTKPIADSASETFNYVSGTQYKDGMRILEALSATGLRSIRYAKEIAGVQQIIANDFSRQAVESIRKNVSHNGVEHLIEASLADATTLMYMSTSSEKRFDVVDLDPYGCPSRFLDGAMQCLVDGGILLVTATDMAVLAGNVPESCYVKYGSVSLRMKACHEMALRILLHSIDAQANRHGRYIEPLLSISADFYVRVFVRVHVGLAKCKFSLSKQSMIYQCTGCETFTLHPLGTTKLNPTESNPNQLKFGVPTGPPLGMHCEHCGHKHHLGGPVWSAPIHNTDFVKELLQAIQSEPLHNLGTQRRLNGVLSVILEELEDVPLYYTLDKLCSVVKVEVIPILKFRSALLHAGYRVSFSHACKNSIKTDAPPSVLWDILRCWSKEHPVNDKRCLEGTPVKAILSKNCNRDYIFHDIHPAANPNSRKNSLSRFPENPAPHWGPGTRATIMIGEDKIAKSFRNQNRKTKHKLRRKNQQSVRTDDDDADAEMNRVAKLIKLVE